MADKKDEEKHRARVVSITDRIPARFIGDDPVIKLASRITMVLINNPGSAVDYLTALGVVGKAVRDLLRASGLNESEVDALATEALHRCIKYSIQIGNKDDGGTGV
jgi:hypothetical protein